ncbi:hypothetical protein [Loigolactobacillus zhaoyuanensis]|uniref:Uncharacterized protein n=1 Tax=Loigolactobacillus zhaoyuanensis TaxID=2486017 RepID=A0ABW8UE55_9LACO|nr:hypothetical protein [Loigolactobacillus zhaoyuanensis]
METKWKIVLATVVCLALVLGILATLRLPWALTLLSAVATLLLVSVLVAIISYVFGVIESSIRRN